MKKIERIFFYTSWIYLFSSLLAVTIMYISGDRWWPGTLLLFGPRWLLAVPLFILVPLALLQSILSIIPLILSCIVLIGPFMGFQYHLTEQHPTGSAILRVLSCNINMGKINVKELSNLIIELDIDLISLQECPRELKLNLPPGWHDLQLGGLSIFSKYPLKSQQNIVAGMHLPDTWPRTCMLPCLVKTPHGDIQFVNIHLPTARFGIMNMLDRKIIINPFKSDIINSETQNRAMIASKIQQTIHTNDIATIIAGDFNMPVESNIYRKYWSGYLNAFQEVGNGFGWTTIDDFFALPMRVRVDHIICKNGATPVTYEVGADVGSDHRPIIADVAITPN